MLKSFLYFNFPNKILGVIDLSSKPYFKLIKFIGTRLLHHGTTLVNRIADGIQGMLDEHNAQISIPVEVCNNFCSLADFLRSNGLCHEIDTDVLCKTLFDAQLPDEFNLLKCYSDSRSRSRLLDYDLSEITPGSRTLAKMDIVDISNLTLEDVFFMKDFLAYYLNIKRHCFSLSGVSLSPRPCLIWSIIGPVEKTCPYLVCPRNNVDEELCSHFEACLPKLCIDRFHLHLTEGKVLTYPRVPGQSILNRVYVNTLYMYATINFNWA